MLYYNYNNDLSEKLGLNLCIFHQNYESHLPNETVLLTISADLIIE